MRRFRRPNFSLILSHVRRMSKPPVGRNGQTSDRTSEVIRHKEKPAARMQTDIRRSGSSGRNATKLFESTRLSIDREGTHGTARLLLPPIGFIGTVEEPPGSIGGQTTRARPRSKFTRRRQPSAVPINVKQMDPATVSRREIDLGRWDISQRRAERTDICHEWPRMAGFCAGCPAHRPYGSGGHASRVNKPRSPRKQLSRHFRGSYRGKGGRYGSLPHHR